MSISNNPPDVVVELSAEDAELLLLDSDTAIHQLLGVLNMAQQRDDASREHLEKTVRLLEFKKRVKTAVERGMQK